MTTVLFWDVDGTLLTTERAGITAWELAIADVLRVRVDLRIFETAGLTDHQIAAQLLVRSKRLPSRPAVEQLVHRYEHHLPVCLPLRAGRVLKGVRAILEHVTTRPDIFCMLLTGNTQVGAKAKLTHYGLVSFFRAGAFSDDAPDRASIAYTALKRVRTTLGQVSLDRVFVIGDTPHDIDCGKAIGARTVGVATGTFSTRQLEAHHPWWVIDELPPLSAFRTKLGIGTKADL